MPDNSFVYFIKERAASINARGHKGMALSLNHSLWDIDTITSSFPELKKYGFDARLDEKIHQLENGEEGLEFILIVEWDKNAN